MALIFILMCSFFWKKEKAVEKKRDIEWVFYGTVTEVNCAVDSMQNYPQRGAWVPGLSFSCVLTLTALCLGSLDPAALNSLSGLPRVIKGAEGHRRVERSVEERLLTWEEAACVFFWDLYV